MRDQRYLILTLRIAYSPNRISYSSKYTREEIEHCHYGIMDQFPSHESFWSTQILNFRAKREKMLKLVRKLGQTLNLPDFWILCFHISECLNTQIICTKIAIQILLEDKNDSYCKISKNTSCSKKILWLGRTSHLAKYDNTMS